jgi:hypothetical protein
MELANRVSYQYDSTYAHFIGLRWFTKYYLVKVGKRREKF